MVNLASNPRAALSAAAFIFLYWALVFSIPFMIDNSEFRSTAPFWFWCVLCSGIGYFSYTGFRAWRRGWRARFIMRIVVPAALLMSACTIVGVAKWVS